MIFDGAKLISIPISCQVGFSAPRRTGTIVLHVAAPYLEVSRESGEVQSLSHSLVLGCANLRNYVLDPRLSAGDGVDRRVKTYTITSPSPPLGSLGFCDFCSSTFNHSQILHLLPAPRHIPERYRLALNSLHFGICFFRATPF